MYKFNKTQAELIGVSALRTGMSASSLDIALDLADKGYFFGSLDAKLNVEFNDFDVKMSFPTLSLLLIEGIQAGLKAEYIEGAIKAANQGYKFGYSDSRLEIKHNDSEYTLDYSELVRLANIETRDFGTH